MEQRHGFIHDEMDLKVLILFILSRLPAPVARDSLTDATLLCDDAIGYFEFSDCLMDLVKTGHVSLTDGRYLITNKGRENGNITESGLPYSVRMRAEGSAASLSNQLQREAMITASHEMRRRGGYTVKLSMSDGLGAVITMELLCADDKQAVRIEQNFRKNAESVYNKITELLMGE